MNRSNKIIKQTISGLMLVIYLFSSLSILSYHNQNDSEHHDHQHLIYCENINNHSCINSDCLHDSHLISSEESCLLCDHFSICKPAILENMINTFLEIVTVKEIQLVTSLYKIDANNTRNKSPPFII